MSTQSESKDGIKPQRDKPGETVTGVFEPGQGDGGHLRVDMVNYRIKPTDQIVPAPLARAGRLRGGGVLLGRRQQAL